MKRIFLCTVLTLLVAVIPVLAADTPNLSVAAAYTAQAPVIDGVLNDAAWLTASQWGAKVVVDQDNLGTVLTSFPRVAYLAYDSNNLYIAYQIPTQDSSKLVTSNDASAFWNNDEAEVFIIYPGTKYQQITVVADGKSYLGASENQWPIAVGKTTTSWTVEMVIPFANIGAPPQAGDTWQIQLCGHQVADGDLWLTWNPTYGSFSKKARFANLTFLPITN